jgi:hypothetical protein
MPPPGRSTRIAKKALETGRGVMELILEEGLLDETQLEDILKPENMTRPQRRPPRVSLHRGELMPNSNELKLERRAPTEAVAEC